MKGYAAAWAFSFVWSRVGSFCNQFGINPFTKEETVFKAKPARNVVKIRPLKNLKDMV